MSTEADELLPAVKVDHEGQEEYGNIWQKVRSIWKYVHAAYRDEFDWFVIGGDDLFVIASNLRAYLLSDEIRFSGHRPFPLPNSSSDALYVRGREASENGGKPMFLGRRFQIPNGQLFNSGGAGYVLNRAALDLLVSRLDNPACRPHQHVFAEDVNVAHCLSALPPAILPHDTRDSSGGERFHPFTPALHLSWRPPKRKSATGMSPDWYENYNAPWGVKTGPDCCAPSSVSFHYVKPAPLMSHISALLYDCRDDLEPDLAAAAAA
jgi:glycoprotein-N-acetylgalactosamine 3-beta-galactosyltransferase